MSEKLLADLDNTFRMSLATEPDPGSAGTIGIDNKGVSICEVVTAGAETRVLESATHFGVGTRLLVILKTDGGDLTIDSDDADVVLENAGDCAEFVVSLNGASKEWRCMGVDPSGVAARLAVADFSVAEFPIEFGAITLDAGTVADPALKLLFDALIAAGLATGTITE